MFTLQLFEIILNKQAQVLNFPKVYSLSTSSILAHHTTQRSNPGSKINSVHLTEPICGTGSVSWYNDVA